MHLPAESSVCIAGGNNSGVTRVGVTRGGNWRCDPYFSWKKTGDLFSHHRLQSDDFFKLSSSSKLLPSDQLSSGFFLNSAIFLFNLGVTRGWCHPGRPPRRRERPVHYKINRALSLEEHRPPLRNHSKTIQDPDPDQDEWLRKTNRTSLSKARPTPLTKF